MKFTLSTTGYFYPNQEDRFKLEKIGFAFRHSEYGVCKTDTKPEIEFSTLEDLIRFGNEFGEIIVTDGSIEIFDDHRG